MKTILPNKSKLLQIVFSSILVIFTGVMNAVGQSATATWALTSNGNASVSGNITATAVSKGPGRTDYGGIGAMSYTSDGVRSQNWNRASYTTFSITSQYYNRDYYEYTVSPTAGNSFTVNSVSLEASSSTSSPSWYVWYSLDGFSTYTQLSSARNQTSFSSLNVNIPSGSTFTLRVYGMDLVASTTYFRNRNVVISGTTASSCTQPSQPSTITGSVNLCPTATQTYSVTNDPNATSYTWTLPSGFTGTSTTNSISVTSGTTGGTISVTANNACGNSNAQTTNVIVNNIPTQPTTISGSTSPCAGTTQTYSVTNNPNATSYTWTLPSGFTGTSTTNSISVTTGTTGGTVSVTANNTCGSSTQQTVNVVVNNTLAQPSAISGSANTCAGTTQTYSVTNNPSATSYTWTLPSGWSGTSTTNSISVTTGTTGGIISVTANNTCGSSTAASQNLSIIAINSTVTQSGHTLSANESGASYQWINCSDNTIVQGAIQQSFTPSAQGQYAVIFTKNGCTDTSSCTNVSFVGINEANNSNMVSIYPNPASDQAHVRLSEQMAGNIELQIIDVTGRLIYLNTIPVSEKGQTETIQTTSFRNGVYHIRIFKDGQPLSTNKLIINR